MNRVFVENIAERFVEKSSARGFNDAAITIYASKRFMAKYANNSITVVQSWIEAEAEIYLARSEKVYHGKLVLRDEKQIEKIVEDVEKVIERLERSPFYAPLPEPSGRPLQGLTDKNTLERLESIGDYARIVIDSAVNRAGKSSRTAGMLEAIYGYRLVATSRGALLGEEATMVTGYARVLLEEASGHWAWTGRGFREKELEKLGEEAAEYALKASKAPRARPQPGKYTAILSPLVGGQLLSTMALMSSGLAVVMGFSFLAKHKPGDRIGSDKITIIDDPHELELPFSTGFDDEGVATRRKPIVEKGLFRTLLHNSKTAKLLKAKSTGNAGLFFPHPWNIIVEPGDMDLDEMISETRRGFLVNNNWYTRFQNYYEGVFSTVTRDALLYIENGEVKGRVERLRIVSTYPHLLSNIAGLSRRRSDVKWWEIEFPIRIPYIMVEDVEFTLPQS